MRTNETTALRHAEERNQILFERTPVPICVFDRSTFEFLAVNDAMVRVYGYSREEFLTMRLTDVKIPDDLPRLLTNMSKVVTGAIMRVGFTHHRHKDGRVLELDITSYGLEFEGRSAMLAMAVDVTESRKLEDQLRQSQKMEAIGQLAGGVAHDFNNILGVILANAELALESCDDPRPVQEEIREIIASAERAAALTRQLLAFSRQQPRETSIVALNSVVTNLEKMLCRIVGEDIAMSAILAPKLGSIDADVAQLEQILVNLVVNARDAMSNGGKLAIETANATLDAAAAVRIGVNAGDYVVLSVSDTGTGMDAATIARIFEPFFTTKEIGRGTGLGLSMVFGIVKHSGGGIAVTSELGHGTTFRVYLPRIAAAVERTLSMAPALSRGTETVLVVEDDPKLRGVILRHLRALGYSPIEAATGDEALTLLREKTGTRIDLLLTDLVMPGLDGRALATTAVSLRPELRTLFMSGYSEHASVNAFKTTDQNFVEKPFTAAKLAEAIRRALDA